MSVFYKHYLALCSEKKVSPSGAAKAIGLSNAAASGWKKGKAPSDVTLEKLANYFGVPVETLTAGQKEKAPGRMAEDLSADELEIVSILRKMSPEQLARELAYLRQASADGQGK